MNHWKTMTQGSHVQVAIQRGARLLGVMLGVVLAPAALAEGLATATAVPTTLAPVDVSSLQRGLRYELMLGAQLTPEMTSCMDQMSVDGQTLLQGATQISDRVLERMQRLHEVCSAELKAGEAKQESASTEQASRFVTQSLRLQTAQQRSALLVQKQAKDAARSCLKGNDQPAQFKRCLENIAPPVLTASSWPTWLVIFESHRDRSAGAEAG